MDRRRFLRNIAAGSAGLTLGAAPFELLAADDFVTVSILHTNDLHCHIEPFADENERYAGRGGLAVSRNWPNRSGSKTAIPCFSTPAICSREHLTSTISRAINAETYDRRGL
jgi:hypothetical protein